MSNGLGAVRGIPPVEKAGQFLKSTDSASDWDQIRAEDVEGLSQTLFQTWRFTTSTTDAATSGRLGLNAATWAATTKVNINETTFTGVDWTNIFNNLKIGDRIIVQDASNADNIGRYTVASAPVDQGTWRQFTVLYDSGNGVIPANNADVRVAFTVFNIGGASNILPARLDLVGPTITDFNAPKANGWYRPNGAVNGPPGGNNYGLLMHQEWDGNNGHSHQFFYPMYGTSDVWVRASVTYVWQAWFKISPIDDSNLPTRLRTQGPVVTDCNTVTDSGWYACQGATNAPTNGWGNLFVGGWSGPYQTQFFSQLGQTNLFMRACYSSAWTAWVQIFPAPNDDTNLPARLKTGTFIGASVSDVNTALASGWYNAGPGTANNPDGSNHYHIEVIAGSSGYVRQYAHWLYGVATYMRFGGTGGWSPWYQVYPFVDSGLPLRIGPVAANFIADCNTFMTNGWGYTQAGQSANTPYGASAASGPWGVLEAIFMNGTDNGIQRWWQYGTENRYQRSRSNGVWGAWLQTYPITDVMLPSRLKTIADSVADLNTATQNGWYSVIPGATNSPSPAQYGTLISQNITYEGAGRQVFYEHASYNTWMRMWSSGGWGAWVQTWPVVAGGGEIHYSQRTASLTLVSNTVILPGAAATYDGTPVIIEFYADSILFGTSDPATVAIYLVIDGTTTGLLGYMSATTLGGAGSAYPILVKRRWTIPAGSHTVSVTGSSSAGANTVLADTGAAGGQHAPCYLRITKV